MVLLGMAGQAGAGKDSVASWLRDNCGFEVFSFADALYMEVAEAYDLRDANGDLDFSLLLNRGTKEVPTERLALKVLPVGHPFIEIGVTKLDVEAGKGDKDPNPWAVPLSPRWVLQTWGTEYRRAQDPDYWVAKAAEWVKARQAAYPYPEQRPQYFVNTSVRFENEARWIYSWGGSVWHINRAEGTVVSDHVSAKPLPLRPLDRVINNNGTLKELYAALPAMLNATAQTLTVHPNES